MMSRVPAPGSRLARCPAMTRWLWTLVIAGCATSGDDGEHALTFELTAADAALVLDLANYPGVDQAKLDDVVGLEGRAAAGIAAYRAGADARFPSLDDNHFGDVGELDAVSYVGDAAFTKLLAFAKANPAPAAESHEGVAFRGYEAEVVVWGANTVPI